VTAARRILESAAAVLGCLLVSGALVIIWIARGTFDHDVYVSELGAQGEPTAKWFELALLLIVVGGSLVAYAGRRIRSDVTVLRAWTPAVSLWIGCGGFLLASQVTCTTGCPLPVGTSFTWQDLIHTSAAVLAFAAACWGMLQTSFARGNRPLARLSLAAGISVAVIAGIGGIFSLARFQANLGSRFELAATTIAIGWLVVFGVIIAVQVARPAIGSASPMPARELPSALARQDVEHLVGELDQ
jgi:hypothetical protein